MSEARGWRVKARRNGKWTALYDDVTGHEKSAGTYATREEAEEVAQAKRNWNGRGLDPAYKKQITLAEWTPIWLAEHALRVTEGTLDGYTRTMQRHVIPVLGTMPVCQITHELLQQVMRMWRNEGMGAATQRECRNVLSLTFRYAASRGIADRNVARDLIVSPIELLPIRIMTLDEWRAVMDALPTDGARLLVLVRTATGIRPNEARALRGESLNNRGHLDVSWVVNPAPCGTGRRWIHRYGTKNTTRDGKPRTRQIALPDDVVSKWREFVNAHQIAPDDIMFTQGLVTGIPRHDISTVPAGDLGTYIDANGREYRHGTTTAYAARCRCQYCRAAAATYARERKHRLGIAREKHDPYDDYLSSNAWGKVWNKACNDAGLDFRPTAYQLRHTYASWLIEEGVPPMKVMLQLGHTDPSVMKRYVHAMGADEETAQVMGSILRKVG